MFLRALITSILQHFCSQHGCGLSSIALPIGLLILLYTQSNIPQAAEAKNAFPSHPTNPIVAQSAQIETPAAFCPTELGTAIETVTNRPEFSRGRWGILIQTRVSGNTLYSHDADKYFIPASNVKLLTTAALLQLKPQFQIRTSVYATTDGGLRVVGRGDPSLTDVQLKELARQLNQRGIRQYSRLIAEDYFRGAIVNPNWEWEDVYADYAAPVNSSILNQNAVKLTLFPQQLSQPLLVNWSDPIEARQWQIDNESTTVRAVESVGVNVTRESNTNVLKVTGQLNIDAEPESISLAVVNPNEYFLQHFRRALADVGIKQTVEPKKTSRELSLIVNELAEVESPPLSELLKEMNQNSNNLYAEALLRVLGANLGKTDFTDSTAQIGLGVVKATLTQLGVDPSGYVMVDGSGLSRHNLVSPAAIAQTLIAMARSPESSFYRASLPVAGRFGTLKDRFRNTPAEGIVQAKTGTVSGVVALSGYIDPPSYEPLVFSIIVNQSNLPAATLRQAVDEIVLLLTRLHQCHPIYSTTPHRRS